MLGTGTRCTGTFSVQALWTGQDPAPPWHRSSGTGAAAGRQPRSCHCPLESPGAAAPRRPHPEVGIPAGTAPSRSPPQAPAGGGGAGSVQAPRHPPRCLPQAEPCPPAPSPETRQSRATSGYHLLEKAGAACGALSRLGQGPKEVFKSAIYTERQGSVCVPPPRDPLSAPAAPHHPAQSKLFAAPRLLVTSFPACPWHSLGLAAVPLSAGVGWAPVPGCSPRLPMVRMPAAWLPEPCSRR